MSNGRKAPRDTRRGLLAGGLERAAFEQVAGGLAAPPPTPELTAEQALATARERRAGQPTAEQVARESAEAVRQRRADVGRVGRLETPLVAEAGRPPQQAGQEVIAPQFAKSRRGRVVTRTPFRPETLAGIQAGVGEEFAGRQVARQAGALAAEAEASYLQTVSKNLEQMDNERRALAANRQQLQQDDINRMRETVSSIRAGIIDPKRFYRNASTGSKVMMGISVALGGALQGLQGGPNVGLQIVNQAIERDIDAQIQTRDTKLEALTGQRGLYGAMLRQFDDADQAREASRLAYLERVRADIQNIVKQGQSAEQRAQAQVLDGLLQQQVGEIQAKFEMGTRRKVVGGGQTPEEKARDEAARTFLVSRAKAAGTAAGEQAARGGGIGRLDKTTLKGISQKLNPKFLSFINAARNMRAEIGTGGEIPGVGLFEQAIPGIVLAPLAVAGFERPKRALTVRQKSAVLEGAIAKNRAGLAQTGIELERITRELKGAGTEIELRNALGLIEQEIVKGVNSSLLEVGGAQTPEGREILEIVGISAGPTRTTPEIEQAPAI